MVFINSTGNVGIGTTSPQDLLHLSAGLGTGVGYWLQLENTQSGYGDYRIGHNADDFAIFGRATAGNPTTELLTLKYDGGMALPIILATNKGLVIPGQQLSQEIILTSIPMGRLVGTSL